MTTAPGMYRKSVVSFIDVLGFEELIESETDATKIAGVLRHVKNASQIPPHGSEDDEPFFLHFSDSIVRIWPLDGKRNVAYPTCLVLEEVENLVYVQARLTRMGVFLRGGVTVGDVALDEGTAFGPAVIEAYKVESRAALYPRIVVAPAALTAVREDRRARRNPDSAARKLERIRDFVCAGDDGFNFIDYLGVSAEVARIEGGPSEEEAFLRDHKRHVSEKRAHFVAKDPLSPEAIKFAWVARYHNRVVKGRFTDPETEARLSIIVD